MNLTDEQQRLLEAMATSSVHRSSTVPGVYIRRTRYRFRTLLELRAMRMVKIERGVFGRDIYTITDIGLAHLKAKAR